MLRLLCTFILLAHSFAAYANVDKYLVRNIFKPNPEAHQMDGIDFIYMINLDHRPEKYQQSLSQLVPYGINPFRFPAVNGRHLSFELVNDVGVKYDATMEGGQWGTSYIDPVTFEPFHDIVHIVGRTYFCHCMGRAPIAIVLSHLSVLQDALDSGYNTIWVMEDDIQVIKNPNNLSYLIKKLDKLTNKNWDILFTDQDTKNSRGEYVPCLGYAWRPNYKPKTPLRFSNRQDISNDFRSIGARYGAYSMIVRKSGMKKILNFIKTHSIFLPYDMDFYMPNDIRMFCVRDDIVSTLPQALSDNNL